jgi:hypothetical protein
LIGAKAATGNSIPVAQPVDLGFSQRVIWSRSGRVWPFKCQFCATVLGFSYRQTGIAVLAKYDCLSAGLSIFVLALEYENKQFSCCFKAYSRLISYPLFLITFIEALPVLTELEGI